MIIYATICPQDIFYSTDPCLTSPVLKAIKLNRLPNCSLYLLFIIFAVALPLMKIDLALNRNRKGVKTSIIKHCLHLLIFFMLLMY